MFYASCSGLLFQTVPYLLKVVPGCFLLTIGRFVSYLTRSRFSRSFQVVLARCASFQVVPGHFLFFKVRFRSLQAVLGRFRSFHVLASTLNKSSATTLSPLWVQWASKELINSLEAHWTHCGDRLEVDYLFR